MRKFLTVSHMIVNRNKLVYKHRPWFSDTLYSKNSFRQIQPTKVRYNIYFLY